MQQILDKQRIRVYKINAEHEPVAKCPILWTYAGFKSLVTVRRTHMSEVDSHVSEGYLHVPTGYHLSLN